MPDAEAELSHAAHDEEEEAAAGVAVEAAGLPELAAGVLDVATVDRLYE